MPDYVVIDAHEDEFWVRVHSCTPFCILCTSYEYHHQLWRCLQEDVDFFCASVVQHLTCKSCHRRYKRRVCLQRWLLGELFVLPCPSTFSCSVDLRSLRRVDDRQLSIRHVEAQVSPRLPEGVWDWQDCPSICLCTEGEDDLRVFCFWLTGRTGVSSEDDRHSSELRGQSSVVGFSAGMPRCRWFDTERELRDLWSCLSMWCCRLTWACEDEKLPAFWSAFGTGSKLHYRTVVLKWQLRGTPVPWLLGRCHVTSTDGSPTVWMLKNFRYPET